MKEKIEKKIEKIVDYIISKPESEITRDDYEISRRRKWGTLTNCTQRSLS